MARPTRNGSGFTKDNMDEQPTKEDIRHQTELTEYIRAERAKPELDRIRRFVHDRRGINLGHATLTNEPVVYGAAKCRQREDEMILAYIDQMIIERGAQNE